MRNYLFLTGIVFFLLACAGGKSPEDCKTAEGNQWSELKKNCVKLADSKFTLKPADERLIKQQLCILYLVAAIATKLKHFCRAMLLPVCLFVQMI